MIRRNQIIVEEAISKDQNIMECTLIDCKIEKGALIQNSVVIVDGEKVSLDCPCLEIDIEGAVDSYLESLREEEDE
jgi:hypothetical protein